MDMEENAKQASDGRLPDKPLEEQPQSPPGAAIKTNVEHIDQSIASQESVSQTAKQPETSDMEVHHHSHSHGKKNWKTYFWEFLMLFLAVFCGFLAEYKLEHVIEHQREKEFAKAFKPMTGFYIQSYIKGRLAHRSERPATQTYNKWFL